MNKEQAVTYLKFSGFSEEQIKAIEGAFACEDAISRQAVIDEISKARDINLGILPTGHRSYEDILRCVAMAYDMGKDRALNVLRSMPPVNPQKPICPSAGVDCEDCPAYEDAISRKAVMEICNEEWDSDLIVERIGQLPSVSSSEKQKPKSEWQQDHEILKAYSDGASAVLESIKCLIEQYEHYLELLDADMKDGSATIVTKTKYAVYAEVVKQLKEVEVQS